MKIRHFTMAALLSAVAGLAATQAVQGQADTPAPAQTKTQADPQPTQQSTDTIRQVTYLGVYANPLTADAGKALGLPEGTGLVVRKVVPDSPAQAAGVLPGDVLTRLDDQILINTPQLVVLIHTHKAGDKVALHALRDGKAVTLSPKLATHAMPQPRAMMRGPMRHMDGWDHAQQQDPGEMFEQMRRHMRQRDQEMQQMMEQMHRNMHWQMHMNPQLFRDLPPIEGGQAEVQSFVSVNDGEHLITLETDGQSRHLIVQTADGEGLFDGELPEDGKVKGLDPAVQKKVDEFLKNSGIQWRPAQPAPEPAPGQEQEVA